MTGFGFVDALAALEQRGPVKRQGHNWRASCPAHDDHHPSLDLAEGDNGAALLICRSAQCSFDAIVAALGLDPDSRRNGHGEWTPAGDAIAIYHYVDEDGQLLFDVCRTADKEFRQRRPDTTSKSGWRWNIDGVRRVIYRLPQVRAAIERGDPVHVVEGEKDVHRLEAEGLVATCNPMGAAKEGEAKWKREYTEQLAGAREVVVIADHDEAGIRHAHAIAADLKRAGIPHRTLGPPAPGDDVSDHLEWHSLDELVPLDDLEHDPAAPFDAAEPSAGDGLRRPYALPLDEFIAARSDLPAALLGDDVETILAALGLVILFGRGGRGKTTLTIEAALHLASGIAWLVFAVGRPLRILLIENEGPRELFREKLERKLASWPHELTGAIFVYTEGWGAFTLADEKGEAIERLRGFIAANRIDLVIGDPLDTLGVAGVGSPEQTRDFVALMVAAGLGRDVAFWLLHHPRKERADDELDELAGAWGGKPDSVMRLDVSPGDRARLSFPKIRWRRRALRPALILAFDPETESYSVVGEEGEERDLVAEIEELLADDEWRTVKEIAASKVPKKAGEKPGIGADEKAVKRQLEEHPDRFESCTGEEAAALGRRRDAVLWQKRSSASNAHNSDPASQGAKERSGVQRQASIDAELNSAPLRPPEAEAANSTPLTQEAPDEVCVEAPCMNPRAPGAWYCAEHGGGGS